MYLSSIRCITASIWPKRCPVFLPSWWLHTVFNNLTAALDMRRSSFWVDDEKNEKKSLCALPGLLFFTYAFWRQSIWGWKETSQEHFSSIMPWCLVHNCAVCVACMVHKTQTILSHSKRWLACITRNTAAELKMDDSAWWWIKFASWVENFVPQQPWNTFIEIVLISKNA